MHKGLIAVATAVLLPVTAALAGPAGRYEVEGTNPGNGSRYGGWFIAGARYVGTGIGSQDFLAVSSRTGNQTGVALYTASKNGWKGLWTTANGTILGSAPWTEK